MNDRLDVCACSFPLGYSNALLSDIPSCATIGGLLDQEAEAEAVVDTILLAPALAALRGALLLSLYSHLMLFSFFRTFLRTPPMYVYFVPTFLRLTRRSYL